MHSPTLNDRLLALQEGLFLAEIEPASTDEPWSITMAGPRGLFVFELDGVQAAAVAYEALDPSRKPSELKIRDPLNLRRTVEFDPDAEVAGRWRELDPERRDDLLAASRVEMLSGDASDLRSAAQVFELRIESYTLRPDRCDLHLFVVADSLSVFTEEGPVDWRSFPVEEHAHGAESQAPAVPSLDRPAWLIGSGSLPADLEAPLQTYFEAARQGDWPRLAEVYPAPDTDDAHAVDWLRAHHRDLWDFPHARALEGFWKEGPLAAATVRGVLLSESDDEFPRQIEECVWVFSLRRRDDGRYVIRHWSQDFVAELSSPHAGHDLLAEFTE
ncbi:MAG: hypothetical protein KDB53_04330 [Planctomycetes bacterium]|nr:hypothetical protein [Planctomycetota bacterium]